jgi:hypothetical protein
MINAFFDKFKTLKDFSHLKKWNKINCDNDDVFYICYSKLKEIWKKDKNITRCDSQLITFIADLFIILSNKKANFVKELTDLVNTINDSDTFLMIFAEILSKDNSENIKQYILNYIFMKTKENEPLTIYYRLFTVDKKDRKKYLLDNLTVEYAIHVEDFISVNNKISDRILLFANLYNKLNFRKEFSDIRKLDYYKVSIESKRQFNTLKFKDGINICKDMQILQNILTYLIAEDEDDCTNEILLIDFYEKVNKCKEQYNSLKVVLSYWKHFFNFTKKNEIKEILNLLELLDNTSIIEFSQFNELINKFTLYKFEAQTQDKLFNSFIFKGLYNSKINKELKEEAKFQSTLKQFNELKKLGNNANLDILPQDIKNLLWPV